MKIGRQMVAGRETIPFHFPSFCLYFFPSCTSGPQTTSNFPPPLTTSSIFLQPFYIFIQIHANMITYVRDFFIIQSHKTRSYYRCFSCFSHLILYSAQPSRMAKIYTNCIIIHTMNKPEFTPLLPLFFYHHSGYFHIFAIQTI